MSLSDQQRGMLSEAAKHRWVSANMFAGAVKTWPNPRYREVTVSSARAALCRLEKRGLLARHDSGNPALFVITDAGREALT